MMDTTMKLSDLAGSVEMTSVLVRHPSAQKSAEWRDTAFEWRCTLKYQGREFVLPYWCGAGHTIAPKPHSQSSAAVMREWSESKFRDVGGERVICRGSDPKPPTSADVLSSLLLDSSAEHETFADWCANYGSDTDSRKALETYLACQESAGKLRKLLGADFARFTEAENDV